MYDTIIIGAGLSGLAAGIRLAHYDQRVCVLERHYTIGGLNSFYRLRGRDYDVGLHAVTNYTDRGTRRGPLARLLRQLRLRWEDLALCQQIGSSIAFPDVRLDFSNDLDLLRAEIRREFPQQVDAFEKLVAAVLDYHELTSEKAQTSARQVVGSLISDPLLVEMLFAPVMYYGSATEHDMHFGHFSVMFRSILLEGLARPRAGIRLLLKTLVRRFRSLGGELKLRCGVARLGVEDDRVARVVLDGGEQLEARQVLSSAGWVETMRLCDGDRAVDARPPGRLSFCEALSTLDVAPAEIGCDRTIVFFNDSDRFAWHKPEQPCDLRSGVICAPNNFAFEEPLEEGSLRITVLANYDYWRSLPEETYRLEKLRWYDRILASAVRFVPDYRHHIIDTDMFTPTTIVRFTGHANGAIYGAPTKQLDGRTHLKNLFVCGTDQGYVGIVGSITSGISMANRWCLR